MRTILTGRPITSEEALSWGLVCDLTEDCDMLQRTVDTANALTEHGSEALQLAKEAVCRGKDHRRLTDANGPNLIFNVPYIAA